jgi:hypothetical protein
MGVGRRDFLKMMSVAMAGLTISPQAAVAINEDYYINKKLGIIFEKPQGWGYVALADFGMLKDKQIVSNIPDEERNELWETIGGPACLITKYYQDKPEYRGVFSPTIQFFVNHKSEIEGVHYENFEDLIHQSRAGMAHILKDFEVLEEKEPYTVNGCLFYEYDGKYIFEHVELDGPLEVRLNVVIVEHNNYYYYINMHDCPKQNETAQEEFRYFKKSLRMI